MLLPACLSGLITCYLALWVPASCIQRCCFDSPLFFSLGIFFVNSQLRFHFILGALDVPSPAYPSTPHRSLWAHLPVYWSISSPDCKLIEGRGCPSIFVSTAPGLVPGTKKALNKCLFNEQFVVMCTEGSWREEGWGGCTLASWRKDKYFRSLKLKQ